jgi:hypothetical protein
MDGWWDCERLDIFSIKFYAPGWKISSPSFQRYLAHRSARLFNLQSKNPGLSVKSITTSATISSAACSTLYAVFLRLLERRADSR